MRESAAVARARYAVPTVVATTIVGAFDGVSVNTDGEVVGSDIVSSDGIEIP